MGKRPLYPHKAGWIQPELLDLFCKAGGAAMGYYRAGFKVTGVDNVPQPHYPFTFILSDWEVALYKIVNLWKRQHIPCAVHASPPCQRYSSMTKKWGRSESHPDLVAPVRAALQSLDIPYVIENVEGAPLISPVMLCGSMFNLHSGNYQLRRHRLFETSFYLPSSMACEHEGPALPVYGHAGGSSKRDELIFPGTAAWREGMGIDWMTGNELAEAIPPAYTEHIGGYLMEEVLRK